MSQRAPKTLTPRDAKGDAVCRLRNASEESGDFWILTDGYTVQRVDRKEKFMTQPSARIPLPAPGPWTLADAAKEWKCSVSLCRQLCQQGRIPGAEREGGNAMGRGGRWRIPVGTVKPVFRKRGRPRKLPA